MGLNILLILIILLLISYIIFIHEQNSCSDGYNTCVKKNNDSDFLLNSIDGYWISNDDFNKESEIDKMTLYIDFNTYNADLVIIINNKLISNDKYNIYIDDENITKENGILKFKISFSNSNKNTIWNNKNFTCLLSPLKGSFQLYDDNKTIYGDFLKDNLISNFINNL
jgi:hypothetical protein